MSSYCVVMCCAMIYCAVDRVQCGERVITCMIELGVVDGRFV